MRPRQRAGGIALAALALSACATSRTTAPLPPAATPWTLPTAAIGTQRLFRAEYDGPEGAGSLRLTLRLEDPSRFQLTAADRLGRPVWALAVDGPRALWIDHRAEVVCRRGAEVSLPGWEGSPFPLSSLPAVLLGAVPAEPRSGGGASGDESLLDAAGRRWTWSSGAAGRPVAWTLWEGAEPAWWWRREGSGGILSQGGVGARQLRWSEIVAEPLAGPLEPTAVPSGYREECDEALP